MKIYDNKIWRNGQKLGWIEHNHIRAEEDGRKLGYFENNFIFNAEGRKIAYVFENELRFENGQPSVPLEHLNAKIEGTVPLLEKAAVYVLLEE